jgi:hypothetical protein
MAINAGLAANCVAITPSDTTRVGFSAIYVGGAGTVIIEPAGGVGTTVTWTMPAGGYVLCQCVRVLAASTATLLIGLS